MPAIDRLGVFGLTPEALTAWLEEREHRKFRAGQVLEWVYRHGARSFDEMSNLPKGLRAELTKSLALYAAEEARRSEAGDGTVKLLLRWPDGATSECVLIPEGARRTACISTQVGCPVGCVFCASGLNGLARNLTAAEIVEQAMRVRQLCGLDRLTNVVLMGLGEPLANYDSTVSAVRTINAAWGMGIAARKITVSTVGLPRQMKRLAEEGLQITLALSLHAPTDELRRELIPWSRSVTIAELVEAAQTYFDVTGREVTVEYVMLGGVNDRAEHAQQLASVCRQMRSNVNLIPYNPVPSLRYARPTKEAEARFVEVLRQRGVNVHVRRSRGLSIAAACGQLRRAGELRIEN
jgi:23S rRNA (adenine2503-C2)-methyltransferase